MSVTANGKGPSRVAPTAAERIEHNKQRIHFELGVLRTMEHVITADMTELQVYAGFESFGLPDLEEGYRDLESACSGEERDRLQKRVLEVQRELLETVRCLGEAHFERWDDLVGNRTRASVADISQGSGSPPSFLVSVGRGAYLWKVATWCERLGEVLGFCRDKRIGILLASLSKDLLADTESLRALTRRAHELGLEVGALCGLDAVCVVPDRWDAAVTRVRAILDFNASVGRDEAFDAIHLDIEPYATSEMKQLKRSDRDEHDRKLRGLVESQLALCCALKHMIGGAVPLGVDIPFWYQVEKRDGVMTEIYASHGPGQTVKPASHHFMDELDYVSVMAYGASSGQIQRFARNHVYYAEEVGTPLLVAVNCNDGRYTKIDTRSSLYSRGLTALEETIEAVESTFGCFAAFKGVLIHDLRCYRQLSMRTHPGG